MKQLTKYRELESSIDRKLDYVSHPVNIDLYYDTFYTTEKEESIFAYLPNPTHRRAETYNFARYIVKNTIFLLSLNHLNLIKNLIIFH